MSSSAAELFVKVSADTGSAVAGLAGLKSVLGGLAGPIAGTLGIAAIGAAVGSAVEQAAKFQTALVNVQNNTTMTAADMGKLRTAVLDLGQATGVPFEMLSTGFMRVMNITGNTAASMDILKIATESAVSTGGNAATTANILANAMHEYGADVSHAATEQGRHNEILQNATRYMGIFHLAAAEGNMTLEQFADNSGKAVGIAANLGIGVDQVSAAISSLTKHGYDAAMAQTQVVNIMTHMINPAKKAKDEIERVSKATGVDLVRDFSAAGLHARGLTGVMADLRTAFMKMGYSQDEATQSTMVMLNAQRGGLGMSSLIGTAYQDYTSILKDLNNQQLLNTVTSDAFKRSQETLGFQWSVFKEKIQAVAITLGTFLLPALTKVLTWINGSIPKIMEWGSRLIGVFGNIGAGFQRGGLSEGIKAAIEQFSNFGGVGEYISRALVFMQPLVTAVQHLMLAFKLGGTNLLLSYLTDMFPRLAPITQALQRLGNTAGVLKTAFQEYGLKGLLNLLEQFMPSLQPVIRGIEAAGPVIKQALADAWTKGKQIVGDFWVFVRDQVWPSLKQFFGWLSATGLPEVVKAFQAAWPENKRIVEGFLNYLNGTATPGFKKGFGGIDDATVQSNMAIVKWAIGVGQRLDAAYAAMMDFGNKGHIFLVKTLPGYFLDAQAALKTMLAGFVLIGSMLIDGIVEGVKSKATAVATAIASVIPGGLAAAKAAGIIRSPSKLFADQVGKPIAEGMAQGITDNAHLVHAAAAKLPRGLPKDLASALAGGMTGDQFKRGLTFGEARHEDHAGQTAAHHLTRSQIHQRHIQNEALREQHHKEAMARKAARHAHHMQVLAGQHARHQAHIRQHHAVIEGLGKAHHARMTGTGGTGIAPTGLGTNGGSLAPNFDLTINIYEDANGKVSAKTTSKGGMGHLRLHLNQLAGH